MATTYQHRHQLGRAELGVQLPLDRKYVLKIARRCDCDSLLRGGHGASVTPQAQRVHHRYPRSAAETINRLYKTECD